MATQNGPRAPRAAVPDLPSRFDDATGLTPRTEVFAARLTGLSGDVDGAHARLVETIAEDVAADRLDLTGATLADVRLGLARLVELIARDGSWRNVVVPGGRISTLDLQRAALDGVEFRGVRIDYLGASAATLQDVRFGLRLRLARPPAGGAPRPGLRRSARRRRAGLTTQAGSGSAHASVRTSTVSAPASSRDTGQRAWACSASAATDAASCPSAERNAVTANS